MMRFYGIKITPKRGKPFWADFCLPIEQDPARACDMEGAYFDRSQRSIQRQANRWQKRSDVKNVEVIRVSLPELQSGS